MTADPRQSLTIADALMYPAQTGRARFAETVTASLIADAADMRVTLLVGNRRRVFTDMAAIRLRDFIRELQAMSESPEGEQRG